MSCCPTLDTGPGLATPIVYELPLTNLADNGGVLTRDGGVPDTGDAFANSSQWVEGTGCAFWQWTIFNDVDDNESNQIIYLVYPEDGSLGGYGWGYTNEPVSFRRTRFENGTGFFPIFYRNSILGYNHFAIKYDNGGITLYETSETAVSDPGWIIPFSYSFAGLPTSTRWRLRVYVKPIASEGRSSPVIEYIGAQSPCAQGAWDFPPLQWSAEGMVSAGTGGVGTLRFNDGLGSAYYLVPPISDGGNESRSKVIKPFRVTGKLTNPVGQIHTWDVGDEIDVSDLENGTNSASGDVALPDTTQVTQSERQPVNCPNAVLSTIRIAGDDTGEATRDRIDEILIEQAVQGCRR